MQTKNQIEQLLAEYGVRPKRHFGQHFLVDLNLMRIIVDQADPDPDDVVLEIGTGTGSLTKALADRAGFVVGVEVDAALFSIARQQLADKANVHLICGDILEGKHKLNEAVCRAIEQARRIYTHRLLLVANLPYCAASAVLINLIVGPVVADAMTVTVQKEVAERILAQPGSSEYGLLSILLALTGDVWLVKVLRPSVFWPRPNVDSAIIHFVRDQQKAQAIPDMKLLVKIIDMFMGHRRKMLKAIVKSAGGRFHAVQDWIQLFNECGLDPTSRPQQLRPEQYLALARWLTKA